MWPGKSLDREPSRTQKQACLRACTKALNRTLNHQFHRSNTTNLLPFMTLCSKALPSKQPFAARSPDIFLTCVPTDEVIVVFGQIPIFGYDGAWIFPPCRTLLPNPVELNPAGNQVMSALSSESIRRRFSIFSFTFSPLFWFWLGRGCERMTDRKACRHVGGQEECQP
jgi:hypothetical protein